ncbi:S26 family signal peptidase [Tuwongella immobilis]|uniref:Signal peptidase I n=1 Tax=Tuwongella immobilis TaxID=692036 RepID=A0A6C2YND1_9BACT|nr:S26 family signal peptidase [Tuwongella immobilis]VIP02402.1 signal peptidase i : Probable signal peptidase I OS=Planctomyces maris DSM 8797 GN=PM8797T_11911 PE=3 SV=1: Peptidase_S24 [Tuwongella immobilis]VTS01292.1 signal peptidase i : Probable signal peptidase I OS=Planctomyces maris DSM 8797 GN=PM8797T_11911 PE=3 SV=1: Peptidase_S24 [Tuwongella immobilis]
MSNRANAATGTKAPAEEENKSSGREVAETVVFVVVLVMLLKLFVAEAFVIPTGSMAETLWGHQKLFTCVECDHQFPVNSADEVEPNQLGMQQRVVGYTCPNCRYRSTADAIKRTQREIPNASSGDRVLVFKPQYHLNEPRRFDVPVFKYPEAPQRDYVAMNYIKRLIGLPGETIAISQGNVYATTALTYPADELTENGELRFPQPDRKQDLWNLEYTYPQSYSENDLLAKHDFRILRKSPVKMLALSRLVFDNDHQPKSLIGRGRPRWFPEHPTKWSMDDAKAPKRFAGQGEERIWLRYQHLIPNWNDPATPTEPRVITNFMGYNAGEELPGKRGPSFENEPNKWVGDLMLECDAVVGAGAQELILELSKSVDRFQAKFDLKAGTCTLVRVRATGAEDLTTIPSGVQSAGTYQLRFANYDDALTVWVNGKPLDFGPAAQYPPVLAPLEYDAEDTSKEGWVRANDLQQPASIGVIGPVAVEHLKLFRDTYYTSRSKVETYYVQPGHYFCLGDNSAASADSRSWGLVPERLLLGRALLVYYPLSRAGLIE